MHAATNRVNHDFQIRHFLIGACHTPDNAYALLCDLEEDRKNAIAMYAGSKMREQAERLRAEATLAKYNKGLWNQLKHKLGIGRSLVEIPEYLEAMAKLSDIDAMQETIAKNLAAAEDELATLQACKEALEEHRKYAHLPIRQAHEAVQQEEWLLELKFRAENCLLATGSIPVDQLGTMRMHPEFNSVLAPHIDKIETLVRNQDNKGINELLSGEPKFALPRLPSLEAQSIDPKLLS